MGKSFETCIFYLGCKGGRQKYKLLRVDRKHFSKLVIKDSISNLSGSHLPENWNSFLKRINSIENKHVNT